jgi:hypothetical protein
MAWTEPMFIFLGFLGLAFLAEGWRNAPGCWSSASALLVGLAVLTRYAGLALIATGGLGILLQGNERLAKRLATAASFGLVAITPLALWSIRNLSVTGTATSRSLNFHLIERSQLWQGMATTSILVARTRKCPHPDSPGRPGIAGTGYWRCDPLVMAPTTPESARFWHHRGYGWFVYPGLWILPAALHLILRCEYTTRRPDPVSPLLRKCDDFGGALQPFVEASQARFWRVALLGCSAILVIGYGQAALSWLQSAHQQGIGFSARAWQQSPVMAEVRDLPADILVYTNSPEAVYFNGNHRSLRLPRSFETVSQQANPNYDAEIAAVQQQLATGQAVVVFFTRLGRQVNPSEAELVDRLSLELVVGTLDGNIYISQPSDRQSAP